MAGNPTSRAYTPDMSKGWQQLGFGHLTAQSSFSQNPIGRQDIRIPLLPGNQINTVRPNNFQGLQLRQYQCLLSRGYNIHYLNTYNVEGKAQQLKLRTNAPRNEYGPAILQGSPNRSVKALPSPSNLLARATAFARLSNRVPNDLAAS